MFTNKWRAIALVKCSVLAFSCSAFASFKAEVAEISPVPTQPTPLVESPHPSALIDNWEITFNQRETKRQEPRDSSEHSVEEPFKFVQADQSGFLVNTFSRLYYATSVVGYNSSNSIINEFYKESFLNTKWVHHIYELDRCALTGLTIDQFLSKKERDATGEVIGENDPISYKSTLEYFSFDDGETAHFIPVCAYKEILFLKDVRGGRFQRAAFKTG